jgi:hypothetical protein
MQRDDFRDDLPVSRGQWRAIACLLCELTDSVEIPSTRAEATELIVRLRNTHSETTGDSPGDDIPF